MALKRKRKGWRYKKERKTDFGKHFDSIWNNVQFVFYRCFASDIVRTDENLCTGACMGVCGRDFHGAKARDAVFILRVLCVALYHAVFYAEQQIVSVRPYESDR